MGNDIWNKYYIFMIYFIFISYIYIIYIYGLLHISLTLISFTGTKNLYSGWKVENATLLVKSFYWKISGRKWDFMSLFFKRFLGKWEWFMKKKNCCSWTKFTSLNKVSFSVLSDFRGLVTNNSYYVLYWAFEQFLVKFS